MSLVDDTCGPSRYRETLFVDVDPAVASGEPLVHGIRPVDVVDRVRAGDDWLDVCEDFGLSPSDVRALLLLTQQLHPSEEEAQRRYRKMIALTVTSGVLALVTVLVRVLS